MLQINYDKQGDILEIKFSDESIMDSEYLEDTGIVVDYDKNNKIVGLEIISYSQKVGKKQQAEAVAL